MKKDIYQLITDEFSKLLLFSTIGFFSSTISIGSSLILEVVCFTSSFFFSIIWFSSDIFPFVLCSVMILSCISFFVFSFVLFH